MSLFKQITLFFLILSGLITLVPGLTQFFASTFDRVAITGLVLWCAIPFGFISDRTARMVKVKIWQWLLAFGALALGGVGLALLVVKALHLPA
ncbi:hypothetical protein [Pseudomonas serbica]|jgi:hypothetical protein|uniref:hypothetical protein n=1 Tax=Pseudomonas serbica TaxID=2965074 RepID=UPI00237A8CBB|nr:hypothetical protein [Pseudomonas serbica]